MPIGINNVTVVTQNDVIGIVNGSDPMSFFVNVNTVIFGGIFWFTILCVIGLIMYLVLQQNRDQPLNNIMVSSFAVSMLSFFLRAVNVVNDGVVSGMITDEQLWIFPLITIITGFIIWSIKE